MLRRVHPSDVSPIEHEFHLAQASELYRRVLVVRFRGVHRGMDDARFMEAHVALGMALFSPDALVVDVGGLAIEAPGTVLENVVRSVEPNLEEGFPLYVVVAPENREAAAAALPEPALVGSLDQAIERIRRSGPWAVR